MFTLKLRKDLTEEEIESLADGAYWFFRIERVEPDFGWMRTFIIAAGEDENEKSRYARVSRKSVQLVLDRYNGE